MSQRKRYAVVGTGGRARFFIDAMCDKERFYEYAQLVGLCDISSIRMDIHNQRIQNELGYESVPMYVADDFDRMIEETKPDIVIVTTMDCWHHKYIVRAMELGCDVVSEKPMTIDAEKAKAIFDGIERTGKKLRVTFNYRYQAGVTKLREYIMNGVIGVPKAVDFSWLLDTSHGADYFRRWHREKDKSGGLLVHKATHHFDLVNWWIDSYPQRVFCMGELKFYGKDNAAARGEFYDYDRYTGNEEKAKNDPFALFLKSDEKHRDLYIDGEADSGYIRDRNVFGDNFDIEDTMAVMCKYRNGVIMNYSLIAYTPWEGYHVWITGDKGRIEYYDKHGSHIIRGQSDEELAKAQGEGHVICMKVFPMFGVPYEVEIPVAEGSHGGGDKVLLEQIFLPNPPKDPFNRAASHIDGAASIMMGICANRSIETGLPIDVDDMFKLPKKG